MDRSLFPYPSIILPLFLSLLSLFLSGCAFHPPEPCVRHGKVYGITDDWIISHDWDSCYRRAVSYAQGECWTQAMSQFSLAIRQRPNDQWRARSYGMHVLDEYFPHREMGIIYLQLGKLEEAIEELNISLATADSAKAKYYLNQARKRWLERTGLDRNPPGIHIYIQPDGLGKWLYTNRDIYPIKGEALDDYYVSSILINEQPLFIDLAQPVIPFSKNVSLKTGRNHFLCKVTDLTGKERQEDLWIFLDQQGPSLFFSPKGPSPHFHTSEYPDEKKDHGNTTILKGLIFDAGGLDKLVIGEEEIPLKRGETHREFQIVIPLSDNPAFWARDLAGNVTRGDLAHIWNVRKRKTEEWNMGEWNIKKMEKSGDLDPENGYPDVNQKMPDMNRKVPISINDHFKPILVAANGQFITGLISGRQDNQAEKTPRIYIEECPSIVFHPSVVILGRIETWSEITEAWINDEPLLFPAEDNGLLHILSKFWYGERTIFYFTRLIKGLKEGENCLTIRVKDRHGRSTQKDIIVEYQVREIERIGNRWCLAILPFQVQEMDLPLFADPSPGPISSLTEGLHLSFFLTERFRLVERERIDSVMNELGMRSGYVVDDTTGPRLGKLLVAEVLLAGSFREGWDGRDRCLEIIARLVDVETSNVLSIKSVYNRWKNKKDEEYLLSGLARIFQHEFPLVRGEIINKKQHIFEINLTTADMIKQGMKVLVYRPPEDRQVQNILGEARLEEVTDDFSSALPSTEKILNVIRIGDLVITK